MRIQLPFTGTVLSDNGGGVPSFDWDDLMHIVKDDLGGHATHTLLDTFDFDEGTVEVEVTVEPRLRIKMPDDSEIWSDDPGIATLTEDDRPKVIGRESGAAHADRVEIEEAAILNRLSGKSMTDIRSASKKVNRSLVYTDARPQEQKNRSRPG